MLACKGINVISQLQYFKTLSVGLSLEIKLVTSRSAFMRSTDWANPAVVNTWMHLKGNTCTSEEWTTAPQSSCALNPSPIEGYGEGPAGTNWGSHDWVSVEGVYDNPLSGNRKAPSHREPLWTLVLTDRNTPMILWVFITNNITA